jgi:hypothetical protein
MSLNASQIYAQTFAQCFGIETPAMAQPSLQRFVLNSINAVRKNLFLKDPAKTIIKIRTGAVVFAPTVVNNMGVTQYSTALTGTFQSWMDGCTVNVSGDDNQNKLIKTGASTWALEAPYTGATGTVEGTVFNDAITLSQLVASVERPIEVENQTELLPLNDDAALRGSAWSVGTSSTDYGRLAWDTRPGGYPSVSMPRQSATPIFYKMETAQLVGGFTAPRIRIDPMPDKIYVVKWWERKLPADITTATDTTSVLTPAGMDESIFLPMMAELAIEHPQCTMNAKIAQMGSSRAQGVLNSVTRQQPWRDWNIDVKAGF